MSGRHPPLGDALPSTLSDAQDAVADFNNTCPGGDFAILTDAELGVSGLDPNGKAVGAHYAVREGDESETAWSERVIDALIALGEGECP